MSYLNSLPLDGLLWLVPIFFTFHNLEELPFMEGWSKTLPLKVHPIQSTKQFAIALTVLTLAAFLLTYLGIRKMGQPTGSLLILGMQMTLAVNVFVPHLFSIIRFRSYSPGSVTGLLITLPFSIYLFQRAFSAQLMTWGQFWVLIGLAPFIMVSSAMVSLKIGSMLSK